MRLFLVFIFISFKVLSQSHEFSSIISYDFILEAQSFKDFTNDYFVEARKKNKIRTIKIISKGSVSLDSLYNNDYKSFKDVLNEIQFPFLLNHSEYTYVELYEYNYLGVLISYKEYPVCEHLTSVDSLKFRRMNITSIKKGNRIILSEKLKDTISCQLTFQNNQLISKYQKNLAYTTKRDSLGNILNAEFKEIFELYIYTYFKNCKLDKIYLNNRLILEYKYPKKNIVKIKNFQFDDYSKNDQIIENVITKSSKNKIISILSYQPNNPKYREEFILEYDKNGDLLKITKKELESVFMEYTNSVDDLNIKKTSITKVFGNNLEENLIYTYDENGFLMTRQESGRLDYFKYTFFD
jgi:hypothetical protein